MRDIESKEDLEMLMDAFYSKALQNPIIGSFFTEIAKIDLKKHLPKIVAFWDQQLFRTIGYKENVMQIHKNLNTQQKIEKLHYETWLSLFNDTVDKNFKGTKANLIKTRALSIATIMQIKIT